MGKRKKSKDDLVESIIKKVRKMIEKENVSPNSNVSRRQRRSSSSELENGASAAVAAESEPMLEALEYNECDDLEPRDEIPILTQEDKSDELNNDILELLGTDPSQKVVFGDNLHKDVASRWNHILQNGLPKEEKADILKLYLPAENCTYMRAPKLNAEIKSAIPDAIYKKDAYNENKQNQMASCLSAIGKALNSALSQTNNIPQGIIKQLSDAGRILCDTHYRESLSRRYNIINSLSKQKRDIIKNTKIDENLFGADLCNHLKSSKEISKSAAELRPYKYNNNQPTTSVARRPTTTTLNAKGWPRAPGAAAEQRAYPQQSATARRPPPPAARAYRRDAPPLQRPPQHRYNRQPAQRR